MPLEPPLLRAEQLSVHQGRKAVVHGASLQVRAGEWVALVGPNGAGKSSLLAAMAGVLPTASGTVHLHGQALSSWVPKQRACTLAWLGQHPAEAAADLRVADVVALGRWPHSGTSSPIGHRSQAHPVVHGSVHAAAHAAHPTAHAAAITQALRQADIAHLSARRLGTLSGGERQRVHWARLLATQAQVWLLDEPTTHLDAPHQAALVRQLHAHAANGGGALVVLHDLNLALGAPRLVVMQAGALLADGPPHTPAVRAALVAAFGPALRLAALEADPGRQTEADSSVRWVAWLDAAPSRSARGHTGAT